MKLDINDKHREHTLLEKPFQQVISPLQQFIGHQSTAGLLLILATVVAMIMANSEWKSAYQSLINFKLGVIFGEFELIHSAVDWVNEALIVLFFFLLGLEIKYEVLAGELKEFKSSILAIVMAIGGMVVPAFIYLTTMSIMDGDGWQGWGIAMATDTAFALGLLVLLGARIPKSLLVMITALAIIDDMGAVLIISLFYTENISLLYLAYGGVIFMSMILANMLGVRAVWFYLFSGIFLWWFVSHSGVHATTAGILAALTVPTKPVADTHWFTQSMERLLNRFKKLDRNDSSILEVKRQHELAQAAEVISKTATTPVQRWQSKLIKPIGLVVLPLFALLNAGVELPDSMTSIADKSIFWSSFLGLFLGKPLGIFLLAFVSIRYFGVDKPSDMLWRDFLVLGCFAGIGFTMSLFIANLAFLSDIAKIEYAKLGIIAGSLLSATVGILTVLSKTQRHDIKDLD